MATTVLAWSMLLGGHSFGQDDGTEPATSPSLPRDRPAEPVDSPDFDAGQETPAPPVTPTPAPSSYSGSPPSTRFLLGDLSGLRRLSEELGISVYTSFAQYEQGVAAGGLQQSFTWGGKFDMLAHLDSNNLGLWEGGTLDLFAESQLGQSVDPDDPDRGLGMYIQTGLGDGNPNPVRWFVSAALCANSPLSGREGDIFGVGFYDLGPSAQAKNQFPGLRDEWGVELFYNLRITPGCHLTPDLQVLHPGLAPVADAILFGVRLKVDF